MARCPRQQGQPTTASKREKKIVKAIWASQGIDFPRTHDIAALAGLIVDRHPLKAECLELARLTPYAVAYRYPAEDEWDIPLADDIELWHGHLQGLIERLLRPDSAKR
ncbi:MAG: HEPN domain-containing protein [Rhodospirillales bacterium]|nr:HEPN domain-containing protein [Rhodospirillales bacterium]